MHKLILCSQLAKTIFNTLTFLLIRLEQFYEYDLPLTIAYQQIVNKEKQERNAYMCGLCCFLRRLNTLESDPISLPRYSFPNLYIVLFTYASKCLIVDCEPSNIDLFPGKYLPRPSINIKYVFVFTKLSWQPIRDRNCPMEISILGQATTTRTQSKFIKILSTHQVQRRAQIYFQSVTLVRHFEV